MAASEDEWRQARRGPADIAKNPGVDPRTGEVIDPPNVALIEHRILQYEQAIEDILDDLKRDSQLAAEARSGWEKHKARVALIVQDTEARSAEDVRVARAMAYLNTDNVKGEDLYHTHLILEAHLRNLRTALEAKQSQASMMQSILKGLQRVTGLT